MRIYREKGNTTATSVFIAQRITKKVELERESSLLEACLWFRQAGNGRRVPLA